MLKEGINNTANTKDGTDGLCLQVVVVVVVVAMTVHPV